MKLLRRSERLGLAGRLDALEQAAQFATGRLPDSTLDSIQVVLSRSNQRRRLSGEHTVVALAGATGSGKSSLFNALSGMQISRVGVRRPTTAEPIACVWGTRGVAPLLDWLSVPRHLQISRESVLDSGADDELDGLVLVDLPDHDSAVRAHRATVDRLVEMVDLFVWVLDPQKYADAVMHERYLRPLATHRSVMVVVLNHIDRLTPSDAKACVNDLERLLAEDGLEKVPVVALSARTGQGVDDLRELVRRAVTKRRAARERISADIRAAGAQLDKASGEGEPGEITAHTRTNLVDALSDAAGIDTVAAAVGRSDLVRARAATGWPLTRWIGPRRPKAIRELGLGGTDIQPELIRTSRLKPPPIQRAGADSAVRELGVTAAGAAPGPWRESIEAAATAAAPRLPDALDRAVAATDLDVAKRPTWWSVAGTIQWLALAIAALGTLWLLAIAASSFLEINVSSPDAGALPVPALLLIAGVLVGLVVALVSLIKARSYARMRTKEVRRQLRDVVGQVAGEVVIEPVEAELERYRQFRAAVETARGH